MKIENPLQMTPEQIAADEAEIKKIRERNLAARAAEAAKEKSKEAETYAFDDARVLSPDKKALDRLKQIQTLRKEISEM